MVVGNQPSDRWLHKVVLLETLVSYKKDFMLVLLRRLILDVNVSVEMC